MRLNVCEDRRLNEVAPTLFLDPVPSKVQIGTLLFARLDIAQDLVVLYLAILRTLVCALLEC